MVVERRLLFAAITAASLMLSAALPVAAATVAADPDPLRREVVLRVRDIQAEPSSTDFDHGSVVAVGWSEGRKPGTLYLTWSRDGGKSYRRSNGMMRQARIAGTPAHGMSLDICGGQVWAVSGVALGADDTTATDVMLSSRDVVTSAGKQSLVTASGVDRIVRNVSVACVGNKLLAIGWLQKQDGKIRTRLVLRSLELPGDTPAFRRAYGLGGARWAGGLDVAATPTRVHVAWSKGANPAVAYKGFVIGDDGGPTATKTATRLVGRTGADKPRLSSRGKRVALAFVDAGRIKVRVSKDRGATFDNPKVVLAGTRAQPARLYSIDTALSRIVVGAAANNDGKLVSKRIGSNDLGKSWNKRTFGNDGARMGALLKRGKANPLLREAWHNAAAGDDTLRANYQR